VGRLLRQQRQRCHRHAKHLHLHQLTIEPLNKAPVVGIASTATWPSNPIALDGSVSDDNFPAPVSLTTLWSKKSGPGTITFATPALADTTAELSQEGSYVLRFTADDTSAKSFQDIAFTGYLNAFQVWQAQQLGRHQRSQRATAP
jgi:hypothetical protein